MLTLQKLKQVTQYRCRLLAKTNMLYCRKRNILCSWVAHCVSPPPLPPNSRQFSVSVSAPIDVKDTKDLSTSIQEIHISSFKYYIYFLVDMKYENINTTMKSLNHSLLASIRNYDFFLCYILANFNPILTVLNDIHVILLGGFQCRCLLQILAPEMPISGRILHGCERAQLKPVTC